MDEANRTRLMAMVTRYVNGQSPLVDGDIFRNFSNDLMNLLQDMESTHRREMRELHQVDWSSLLCLCGSIATVVFIIWQCLRAICRRYRDGHGSYNVDDGGDDDDQGGFQAGPEVLVEIGDDGEEDEDMRQERRDGHDPGVGDGHDPRPWERGYSVQMPNSPRRYENYVNVWRDPNIERARQNLARREAEDRRTERMDELARGVNLAMNIGMQRPPPDIPPRSGTSAWSWPPRLIRSSVLRRGAESNDWRADAMRSEPGTSRAGAQSMPASPPRGVSRPSPSSTRGITGARAPPAPESRRPTPRKRVSNTSSSTVCCFSEEDCDDAEEAAKALLNLAKDVNGKVKSSSGKKTD